MLFNAGGPGASLQELQSLVSALLHGTLQQRMTAEKAALQQQRQQAAAAVAAAAAAAADEWEGAGDDAMM